MHHHTSILHQLHLRLLCFNLEKNTCQAIVDHDLEKLNYLCNHGMSAKHKLPSGLTLLHYAVFFNDPKIINFLVANGAHINSCNYLGMTPLFLAVRFRKYDSVKALLKLGADPYLQSDLCAMGYKQYHGLTPLELAEKLEDKRLVHLLKPRRARCRL